MEDTHSVDHQSKLLVPVQVVGVDERHFQWMNYVSLCHQPPIFSKKVIFTIPFTLSLINPWVQWKIAKNLKGNDPIAGTNF